MANKNTLMSQIKNNKEWNFNKGHMSLGFTINVDVKTDLKDFRDLLVEATKAIDNELKKFT